MEDDSRDSHNPFGISDSWASMPSPELLAQSGAGFVRVATGWPIDLTAFERRVETFLRSGVQILGVLGPSPDTKIEQIPTPPEMAQCAQQLVARFKDRIRHWEFWHQPDDAASWPAQDEFKTYIPVLLAASTAAKSADPTCMTHLGGLSTRLPKSLQWLYRDGAQDAFDVVHIHPFLNPLMPDSVGGLRYFYDMVQRAMITGGDTDKPIWFSHIACPGVREKGTDWFLGKNPSERQQGEWVRVLYEKALTWKNVQKVFWGGWADTPGRHGDGSDFYGLVRASGEPKPAFERYAELARTVSFSA